MVDSFTWGTNVALKLTQLFFFSNQQTFPALYHLEDAILFWFRVECRGSALSGGVGVQRCTSAPALQR